MAKYRKKPVVIEAWEFGSGTPKPEWLQKAFDEGVIAHDGPLLKVKTLEGEMSAFPGSFIIQGIKGEIYPCEAEIFEATYEHVDD